LYKLRGKVPLVKDIRTYTRLNDINIYFVLSLRVFGGINYFVEGEKA